MSFWNRTLVAAFRTFCGESPSAIGNFNWWIGEAESRSALTWRETTDHQLAIANLGVPPGTIASDDARAELELRWDASVPVEQNFYQDQGQRALWEELGNWDDSRAGS